MPSGATRGWILILQSECAQVIEAEHFLAKGPDSLRRKMFDILALGQRTRERRALFLCPVFCPPAREHDPDRNAALVQSANRFSEKHAPKKIPWDLTQGIMHKLKDNRRA